MYKGCFSGDQINGHGALFMSDKLVSACIPVYNTIYMYCMVYIVFGVYILLVYMYVYACIYHSLICV